MRRCEVRAYIVVVLLVGMCLCYDEHDINNQIQTQPDIPFRITRVTKQESADSFKVKIEYQASSKPLVYLHQWLPEVLEEQKMGVLELDVPNEPHPEFGWEDVDVHFIVSGLHHTATLSLHNTSSSMEVPAIELIVPQGHDLRYAPGSQPELSFAWTVGGDSEALHPERGHYTITTRSGAEENVVNRTGSYWGNLDVIWVEKESLKGHKGLWRGSGSITSTLVDPEGVLDVFPKVRFNCAVNCLLKEFVPNYRVRFYRSDHAGPYPPNFMGFVLDAKMVSSTVKYCDVFEIVPHGTGRCVIPCDVVGSLPSQTRISKVLPNGDVLTVENNVMLSSGNWSKAALVVAVGYADRDVYRCTATSDVSQISKDITVVASRRPEIDRNASSIVRHENGTLTGVCVARGVPAPNISFTESYHTPLRRLSPDLYDVSVTHPEEWTTRVELVIADAEAADRVDSLDCFASNAADYTFVHSYRFTDEHHMSLFDYSSLYSSLTG